MATKEQRWQGGTNQELGMNTRTLLNIDRQPTRTYCIAQGTLPNILC